MTLLRCPGCGDEMSLGVLISHNELRQATVDLVEKGLSLGSLVLRYVGLFRPATNRMSADRFAKLVIQLAPDIEREHVHHRGRDWIVPRPMWEQGLEAMLEKAAAGKLTLPLDSHVYLYTVLVGLSERVEAARERETEQARQAAPRPAVGAPVAPGPVQAAEAAVTGMPAHIREQAERIRRGESITGGNADA